MGLAAVPAPVEPVAGVGLDDAAEEFVALLAEVIVALLSLAGAALTATFSAAAVV